MELTDLHVHSTASDGTFTPTELVLEAKEKGLKAFALTDHDTVNGIEECIAAGKKYGIEVIPGIEISTSYSGSSTFNKEVHIVGLFIDYKDTGFIQAVSAAAGSRDDRNNQIIEMMNNNGYPISLEEMRTMFGEEATLTRAHFASWMREKGYVKDNAEAFNKYFGDGKPFYIPRAKVEPTKAIRMIHDAGGVAILAHPILYNMSEGELNHMCKSLKKAGLDGIEAIYSTYRNGDEILIRRLAKENNLLISGGSDFHGANKPYIHLGIGRGNLKVPYELAVNLRKLVK